MRGGGFTVVEVLVALCVLAGGVMGALATQATALRTRAETRAASQAVVIAAWLADQMRANRALFAGVDAGNPYLGLDFDAGGAGGSGGGRAGDGPGDTSGGRAPPAGPACGAGTGAGCDAADAARADVAQAAQAIAAGFPRGRIAICRDVQPVAAADPQWACTSGPGAPVVIKIGWLSRAQGSEGTAGAAGPVPPRIVLPVPDLGGAP